MKKTSIIIVSSIVSALAVSAGVYSNTDIFKTADKVVSASASESTQPLVALESAPSAPAEVDPNVEIINRFEADRGNLFIRDAQLYVEGWDNLAQPNFWMEAMKRDKHTSLLNIAATREILGEISTEHYYNRNSRERDRILDSVRRANKLPGNTTIYVTKGKSHFYQFDKVKPHLAPAIKVFKQEGVDPWFAQTIMLIESPNKLQKSNVGAYGSFQLMPDVAQKYGLTINSKVDERDDMEKSAAAAARLIKAEFIPYTKELLNRYNLKYSENDLWFKLMVMHCYHAGHGNVGKALAKINPKEGGISLLKQMWKTEAGGFGNASQNYSQVALASLIRFDQLLDEEYQINSEDKAFASLYAVN